MSMRRLVTLFCSIGLAPWAASFAQTIRVGGEFVVNSYTSQFQSVPVVAASASGAFVVTWLSYAGVAGTDVRAQRFDASGNRQGLDFQVNTVTLGYQTSPVVALDAAGDFVVVWEGPGVSGYDVFAQIYEANGIAVGAELRVNLHTEGDQRRPWVALDDDGDFVVVWESFGQDGHAAGVFGARFSSSGAVLGEELQINGFTGQNQFRARVGREGNGDFVVVWESYLQDGAYGGIFGQRFSSSGGRLGGEFPVNTFTNSVDERPALAVDQDGDFVVVWQSYQQYGSGYSLRSMRFSSNGAAASVETGINLFESGHQRNASVAMGAAGDFAVAWQSDGQDGSNEGIVARRFDLNGVAHGVELQVNSYTTFGQTNPAVALDDQGDFVVAWESYGRDGHNQGVVAQRFETLAPFDVDGDGSTAPLTDGLLTLRYHFGFRGATLIDGAVNLTGCSRCTAQAIEAYLAGMV